MLKRCLLFGGILLLSGCASNASVLMHSTEEYIKGPWQGYEPTEEFYNGIKPYETTMVFLKNAGFDPKKSTNVKVLSALEVAGKFLISPSIKVEDLPAGIQDCLKDYDACRGYEVGPNNVRTRGEGDMWKLFLRWTEFESTDRTTGWEAKFFIFAKGDMVVYKLWGGGVPNIDKTKVENNPLGPFREFKTLFMFIPAF